MLLMKVCRSWNQIAISTPALWAAIRIMDARAHGFEALVKLWLDRAQNRPLHIALHGPLVPNVRDSVHQKAHQVQDLVLFLPSSDDLRDITTSLPFLKTLTISQSESVPPVYFSYNADECVEILRAAPGLVDCTFNRVEYEEDVTIGGLDDQPTSQLTHARLENLRLGRRRSPSSTRILKSLTLPALKDLVISYLNIGYGDLLAFFTRSSPPLESLEMELGIGDEWADDRLEGLFRLVPSLTDLHLAFTTPISTLLEVLANGSSSSQFQFLPRLSSLTIRRSAHPTRTEYETLVRTLSARRASRPRMQTFRLVWWPGTTGMREHHEPDADILLALRQLAADGMKLHIGTEDQSYV
ncbi:hypothetical protein B0H17DRAFT_1132545 [Mycena rosella]|uniref:F-box domain-containing protein n=1 Tax=Mycena rosella TaxID=1033263 RepID=A0AAD7GKK4_MYCRO|nr:hypothetical protein B0H17DRAFT_1132545 [Mycena rosella]